MMPQNFEKLELIKMVSYLAKTNNISFQNMKRAVIYGSAMASFCVEKFGTERLQTLTRVEINERVNKFVNLVRFDLDEVAELA